ncbi:hypothetical protein AAZX31_13G182100 [Glycine max]
MRKASTMQCALLRFWLRFPWNEVNRDGKFVNEELAKPNLKGQDEEENFKGFFPKSISIVKSIAKSIPMVKPISKPIPVIKPIPLIPIVKPIPIPKPIPIVKSIPIVKPGSKSIPILKPIHILKPIPKSILIVKPIPKLKKSIPAAEPLSQRSF